MLLKWGFIAYPKFKWRFPIIDLSIITHRPHSWAAYYDLLALIYATLWLQIDAENDLNIKYWCSNELPPRIRQIFCFDTSLNSDGAKAIFYFINLLLISRLPTQTPQCDVITGGIKHATFLPSSDTFNFLCSSNIPSQGCSQFSSWMDGFGFRSTDELCRLCVLSLHREVVTSFPSQELNFGWIGANRKWNDNNKIINWWMLCCARCNDLKYF